MPTSSFIQTLKECWERAQEIQQEKHQQRMLNLRAKAPSDPSSPPPYDDSLTTKGTTTPDPQFPPPIKATDVPQWEWSNAQCREWFYAFLTTKFNYAPEEALGMAEKLKGFGPNIYVRKIQHWRDIVGDEQGTGIYTWLIGVRNKEGAIPKEVDVKHGYAEKRK